ncbi:MAG: hypothetical protein ACTHLE_04105 [Agriterribacter sp.]
MSKFKQILMELGGTALNIPVGELTALVDKAEDDIDVNAIAKILKDKYRENLNAFGKTQKDEGFKSAERTTAKKFEDSLKSKFNISSDKIGDELIDEVHTAAAKKSADAGKGEMTEEKIKLSAPYLQMENTYKAQLKKAQEEKDKEINDLKAGYTKKETFAEVSKSLMSLWESEGYQFDDDPQRAANKKQDLVEKFASYEWQKNGDTFIAMKDGKPVENEFGHKVEFKDFVSGITDKFYAKKVTDKRNSPHNSGDQGKDDSDRNKQKKYNGVMPKTQAEYDALYESNIPIDQKLEVRDYWRSKQPA